MEPAHHRRVRVSYESGYSAHDKQRAIKIYPMPTHALNVTKSLVHSDAIVYKLQKVLREVRYERIYPGGPHRPCPCQSEPTNPVLPLPTLDFCPVLS
jgi:hypothetical protein